MYQLLPSLPLPKEIWGMNFLREQPDCLYNSFLKAVPNLRYTQETIFDYLSLPA